MKTLLSLVIVGMLMAFAPSVESSGIDFSKWTVAGETARNNVCQDWECSYTDGEEQCFQEEDYVELPSGACQWAICICDGDNSFFGSCNWQLVC